MVGVLISAISGAFGLTYYEGRRAGIALVELQIADAVAKENERLQKVVAEAEERATKYAQQIAKLQQEFDVQLEELSEAAEADPSTTALSSSRMLRLNALRRQKNGIQ